MCAINFVVTCKKCIFFLELSITLKLFKLDFDWSFHFGTCLDDNKFNQI